MYTTGHSKYFKYNGTENLKSDNPRLLRVVAVAREGQQPPKSSAMAQFRGLLRDRGRQPSEIKHDTGSLILGVVEGRGSQRRSKPPKTEHRA